MLIAVGFVILSLMSLVFSGLEMYGTLKRTRCKMISAFVFRFILLAAFSSLLLYQVLMNMDYWNAVKQFVKDSRKGKEAEIESNTIAVLQIASIGLTIFFTAWNLFRVILQYCARSTEFSRKFYINLDVVCFPPVSKRVHAVFSFA